MIGARPDLRTRLVPLAPAPDLVEDPSRPEYIGAVITWLAVTLTAGTPAIGGEVQLSIQVRDKPWFHEILFEMLA